MDNKTYQKLIRMRDDKHKGYYDCDGVKCEECPIYEVAYDKLPPS